MGRGGGGACPAAVLHRQAGAIVDAALRSARERRGGRSLKARCLAPGVRAKRPTFALCCETLRFRALLEEVLAEAGVPPRAGRAGKRAGAGAGRSWAGATLVACYDLLLGRWDGEGARLPEQKAVAGRAAGLRAGLQARLEARGAQDPRDLLPSGDSKPPPARAGGGRRGEAEAASPGASGSEEEEEEDCCGGRPEAALPRWVRVNPLRGGTPEEVAARLRAELGVPVRAHPLVPEVLELPPGTDVHRHPLVRGGALVQQGLASCLPAAVLDPEPGWTVVDACAAPGNKTTHAAARVGAAGAVVAFDASAERLRLLQENCERCGAAPGIVEARHGDFLRCDPAADPKLRRARAVLLDPSCSGSGTRRQISGDQMVFSEGQPADAAERRNAASDRVEALARFQEAALRHALSFPAAQRVVYSTCSVHARENELVVAAVLAHAERLGWRLAEALPAWPRRGKPVFDGGEKTLRVDPAADRTDGFFVALFVRSARGGP